MKALPMLACMLACSTALAGAREWTTTSGGKIEGEYVRCSMGIVVLKSPDGRQVRVQLSRLSAADRAYVQEKLTGKPAKREAAPASTRTWTTTSGRKIEGEYVRSALGIVVLKSPDGRQVRVQLSRLSAADRAYVAERLKEKPAKGEGASARRKPRTSPGNPEVVALMKPGETFTRTADGETGITYNVYVPTSFKSDEPPPLIIAFSPTGDGMGMVRALKPSAEKVGWLVAGCDELRNDMDSTLARKMEKDVLDDILKSLPHRIDRRCLAGMSGGAYRCYALMVSGVRQEDYFAILAFGGWLGGRSRRRLDYRPWIVVAQINGDKDENANGWLEGDAKALEEKNCVVRAFKFPGGHVIGPPEVIDEAIKWLVEEREKLEEQARARARAGRR